MRKLDNDELTFMLCATGYLPPRTEGEENFFEQMYEDYQPQIRNRHVDVDAIINGQCCFSRVCAAEPIFPYGNNDEKVGETGHMAARNFNKLPQDIIEKIKGQHKNKK